MPKIDLDKLLELEADATPSPWKLEYGYDAIFVNDNFITQSDMVLIDAMRNSIKELCSELKATKVHLEDLRKLVFMREKK